MKKKIAYTSITAAVGMVAFFSGQRLAEPEPREVINLAAVADCNTDREKLTISSSVNSDYFDMSTVVDFTATGDGLQLYTADGSGYYWERTEKYE